MKINIILVFSLIVPLSLISAGCSLVLGKNDNFPSSPEEICKISTWNKLKAGLQTDKITRGVLEKLDTYNRHCEFKPSQVDELLEIFEKTDNKILPRKILEALNANKNEKLVDFYKSVAADEDTFLATAAIWGLANSNQFDELINLYESSENNKIRSTILKAINSKIDYLIEPNKPLMQSNKRLLNLYKSIAKSKNVNLAPLALRGLINLETLGNSELWQNWLWSDYIIDLLEEAVNQDYYKLSLLTYFELLALSKKYPESNLTSGFREYISLTNPSNSYFEWTEFEYFDVDRKGVFRQPFLAQREMIVLPKFIEKYPGHPASDNALYRLARAYEFQGDYEQAILLYYKASQTVSGDISDKGDIVKLAKKRTLFLIDLLMSSESLSQFIENHPNHSLSPLMIYSRAIHLIREDNLQRAESELGKFLKNYGKLNFDSLISIHSDSYRASFSRESYLGVGFWNNVEKQIEDVKELASIRNRKPSDQRLYDEASFWHKNYLTAYNYLWRGDLSIVFDNFMPSQWDGANTTIKFTMKPEFVKTVNLNYKLQSGWIRSIQLFQKLLEDYPESKLNAKAKYSIGLNYYQLAYGDVPTLVLDEQGGSWYEHAFKSFSDFVEAFPDSSMADDALVTIAYLKDQSLGDLQYDEDKREYNAVKAEIIQILQDLLDKYPKGDRRKDAKEILKQLTEEAE